MENSLSTEKVIVFGTYDFIHPGHISFFKQAKKLGDYLIVVVARDKFVLQSKKHPPKHSDIERVKQIRKLKIVDKAILGSRIHNYYRTIRTYKPGIIALGYDQKPKIWELKKDLKKHRLKGLKIIRLKPYKPKIHKSSKILSYGHNIKNEKNI